MTIDMAAAWYVVHTHPRAEAKALLNLDRQGFSCYLPRYLKRRRHARRLETVAAPLFPRYLFVALDLACQRWWSIRSTFGVADLVFNGEKASTRFWRNNSTPQGARGRAWIRRLAAKAAIRARRNGSCC
jgi:transcriptional antiterminator RfaH